MEPTPEARLAAELMAATLEVMERAQLRVEAMRAHVDTIAAALRDCLALLERIRGGEAVTDLVADEFGDVCRRMNECHDIAAPVMANMGAMFGM